MYKDDYEWEYEEEVLRRIEIEEMKKYCPGCPAWLGDYYMCIYGGKDNCIYVVDLYER